MTRETPQLYTVDDRLARIEDLLVKLSTKLDGVERNVSALMVRVPPQRKVNHPT